MYYNPFIDSHFVNVGVLKYITANIKTKEFSTSFSLVWLWKLFLYIFKRSKQFSHNKLNQDLVAKWAFGHTLTNVPR